MKNLQVLNESDPIYLNIAFINRNGLVKLDFSEELVIPEKFIDFAEKRYQFLQESKVSQNSSVSSNKTTTRQLRQKWVEPDLPFNLIYN